LNNIYYKINKDFKVKNRKYLFIIKEKRIRIYKILKKKRNNINKNNNLLILLI